MVLIFFPFHFLITELHLNIDIKTGGPRGRPYKKAGLGCIFRVYPLGSDPMEEGLLSVWRDRTISKENLQQVV
jgi:hypothetical protein